MFSYFVYQIYLFLFVSRAPTLNCPFPPSPPPSAEPFAIRPNMTSEWNEFPLKVAVSVSLNWSPLLEVLLIYSDISISSCYPGPRFSAGRIAASVHSQIGPLCHAH